MTENKLQTGITIYQIIPFAFQTAAPSNGGVQLLGAQQEPPQPQFFVHVSSNYQLGDPEFRQESVDMLTFSSQLKRNSILPSNPLVVAYELFEEIVGKYSDRRVFLMSFGQMLAEYNPVED